MRRTLNMIDVRVNLSNL